MTATYVVPAKTLHSLIAQLYEKAGLTQEDATYHAHGLVEASLRGVDSHGVMRTSAYLTRIENGAINTRPNFQFVKGQRAMQVMDADGASGYTAGRVAMEKAIVLAKEYSIGMVMVRNSHHFGAAALYLAA